MSSSRAPSWRPCSAIWRAIARERRRRSATPRAQARGLVVLPELCTTGYAFADESQVRELGEPADGPTVSRWQELAATLEIVIVGGFCECGGGAPPRNSAAIVDADGTVSIYRKAHLWDREQLLFVAGDRPAPVVPTAIGRLGVAVCYDAFFPEAMRTLALAGADVIAVPMNSPVVEPPGRTRPLAVEIVLALAASNANRVFVAQADRIGAERGIEWAGASVICDPDGRRAAGPVSDLERPAMLTAACDLGQARDKRLGHPQRRVRRSPAGPLPRCGDDNLKPRRPVN